MPENMHSRVKRLSREMRLCVAAWFPVALLFLVGSLPALAVPSWWLDKEGDAQGTELLVGRGCADIAESGGEAQAWQYARLAAAGDAALRLAPDVGRETTITESEFGEGASSRLESAYQQRNLVRASLRSVPEIRELQRSRSGDTVYLMVGIPRAELAGVYRRRIATSARSAAEHIAAARREAGKQPAAAVRQYAAALAAFEDLQESLNVHSMLRDCQATEAAGLDAVESLPPRADIETAMAALAAGMPGWTRQRLFEELLAPLADEQPQARGAASGAGERFLIHPLTYGDGDFVSPFGANLADALSPEVMVRLGWRPASDPADATQVFSGRVRETADGVQVVLRRQPTAGGAAAVAGALLARGAVAELGWGAARPPNWDAAVQDEAALLATLKRDPVLRVEMRTDRPFGSPSVFRYGDMPRLWVRSTLPATVRVLHVFSDGTRTLLADGFPIPMDKINQWVPVPLPGRLLIGTPAGVEQILVQAVSGGELPPLATERIETRPGRFRVVVRGDLEKALADARGSELVEDALFSETVYVWTVVEK